jgi:hypothetical protein
VPIIFKHRLGIIDTACNTLLKMGSPGEGVIAVTSCMSCLEIVPARGAGLSTLWIADRARVIAHPHSSSIKKKRSRSIDKMDPYIQTYCPIRDCRCCPVDPINDADKRNILVRSAY